MWQKQAYVELLFDTCLTACKYLFSVKETEDGRLPAEGYCQDAGEAARRQEECGMSKGEPLHQRARKKTRLQKDNQAVNFIDRENRNVRAR